MKKRLPIGIAAVSTLVFAVIAILIIPGAISDSSSTRSADRDNIIIAYAQDVQPFHFTDEEGNPSGIMIDLWNLWSEKTGTGVSFREATWDETLKMVGSGEADAHAGLFYSRERDEYLDYGNPFIDTETHIFRHKSLPQISDVIGLSAYRVGVLKGDYVESYLRESLPEENILSFTAYDEMMEALKEGSLKVFAADTPTGLYVLEQNGLIADFLYESEKPLYRENWHLAVGEGNKSLLKMINEGFSLIGEEEKIAIERKWTWSELSESDALIIGIGRSFEPLAFINSLGQPSGLLVDIWREWSRVSGRPVEFRGSSWTETIEGLKSGAIDIHSGLSFFEERAEFFDFSSRIYKTYTQIYYNPDEEQPESIEGYEDFVVGIQYGTYMDVEFRNAYPEVRIRNYSTGQDLIRALLAGEVKAAVHETHLMDGQLDRLGLSGSVETRTEKLFPSTIHGAVMKGNTGLLQEINKGFDRINPERMVELEKRWISDSSKRFFESGPDEPGTERINLNDEEKKWLSGNSITLSVDDRYAPMNFRSNQGEIKGLSIDYIRLIGDKLGVPINLDARSWPEALANAMEHRTDGIINANRTAERSEKLFFTEPYIEIPMALFTRDDAPNYSSLEDLAGKKIIVKSKTVEATLLPERYPLLEIIEIDTYREALSLLSTGEVDSVFGHMIVINHSMEENLFTNLKINYLTFNEVITRQRIGVRNDKPVLHSILNKAILAISAEEHLAIRNKWSQVDFQPSPIIDLTPEELSWLEDHRRITLGGPDVPPLDFVGESGRAVGIGPDYVDLVGEILGIRFEYVTDVWSKIHEMAEKKEIDGIRILVKTEERESYLNFTESYSPFEYAIIIPKDSPDIGSLQELSGKSLAVLNASFDQKYVMENYPEVDLLPMDTYEDGLRAVFNGEADAFLGAQASASYQIQTKMLYGLKVSATVKELSNDLYLAVRKDWPEFIPILNKALNAITREQHREIKNRWFSLSPEDVDKTGISLTDEESAFMKNNPVIRVHNEMNWPPYNYNESGIPKGYSIDYFNLVADKAGFTVEYISGPTWDEFMDMAKNREIDVMLNIARNEEREQFISYSASYVTVSQRIVYREGNIPFRSLSELSGKKVAMVEGFYTTSHIRDNYPHIEMVLFKNSLDALLAVARNDVDAHIGEFGVSLHLLDKNRLTDLVISPPLDQSDFPSNELHFGVRKDWQIFSGILNKAMAEISMRERADLQEKWFVTEEDSQTELGESSLINIIVQISIIVIVFLVVLFGIYFLTKQVFGKSEGQTDFFSSGKMRSFGLVLLFILVTVILSMTVLGLNRIKSRNVREFRKYMVSLLENTENSLNIWIDHNLDQLELISRDPDLIELVERQLSENRTAENLMQSEGLAELRAYFQEKRVNFENEGFFVISPDRVNIASRRNGNLGQINLIEEQRPNLLDEVFEGQSRFVPPIRSDVFINEGESELPPTMFYAVPLYDSQDNVIAVLTLRDVPMNEFSRFCEQVRIGDSGETYAFDEQGLLLTMSRFDKELKEMGLLGEDQISLLNIAITEPDGNRPFTYMMRNAIGKRDGENFDGYRDYRGHNVFGVWSWNDKYGFGLTTEIDGEEALGTYYTIRVILISILLVTLLLAIGATVLSIIIGQRANAALTIANDELEDRVESRTAQLKKSEERSQSLLEAAPDGMVIVDENHVILQVNNQTEKMFGYSREELIGKEIEILVPEMTREAHVPKRQAYISEDPRTRAMGAIMEIKAQRKDGSSFPADIGLSPIYTEEGLLVVSSVRDITDRKEAEAELRKLSTAVEQSPLSLVITDIEGNIEYVNPEFCNVTGYSVDEVLGKNPRILNAHVQPDDYYAKLWGTISSGLIWYGEFCNLRKNGEKYWESASIAPIKNDSGKITHYVAIKEDITEQKKAAEELTLLNQLVYGSLESADIGAWWVDFNEEDTFHALDTTVKLIGLPVNENDDKSYRISEWAGVLVKTGEMDPEYQVMIDETFEQFTGAVSGKYEGYNATYPVAQLDGSIKWIIARAEVPKRNEDGSALLMTGTLIDITEIKLSQDQLNRQKNEAELIQQVTEIASVSDSTEMSLSKCLASICKSTAWPVGHVYIPSVVDYSLLEPSKIWYMADENLYDPFKTVTEKISFKKGEGLPGRIWESREPVWINNVQNDKNFPRNKLAKDLGVKGAFGFPIFLQKELVAVCEFFTIQEMEPDGQLLSSMKSIGDQIGRVFERKAAEEEIRNINLLSDNALDLTRSGFWKIDYSDPDYYYSSERAADIFGEPLNDELKYHLAEQWLSRIIEADPRIAEQTGKNYGDAVEGIIPRYDATYPYKRPSDGKIVWIRAIGHIIRDEEGNALYMYGVAQDISDVREAEIEIRAQHDRLLKIIEELPIPAAHWKLDGTILHLNKVLTDLLGYTIEDVPTVDTHFEKFYPDPVEREEYKRVWRQFLKDAAETGSAVKPLMLNATTKSGEVKNLLTHTIQIGDRALTLWIDFTEREKYEKALERAKITAEDATKAKSDFLANMSHEIRTPMNAIIGLSHLIQKTDLSRKQDDYIQKISGSAHNLLGIINDILDFSKIEAGKLTMESIDFNLNEVFDNLGSMMGNKTRDKGLELIFDIATDIPPNLVGDPLRLGQILLNLTNNAVKFTEKGEIVVSVEIEEKDQRETSLKFKVRDTGIGLTEEQAGNLFQAFTQADTSTTRKFGGTGLGLSISKKLSEMMGGSIGVESVYGEGATFFFTGIFQYRKAKKREVLPEEIRNLNVLIVDDNATSREVLTAYARDFSFSSVAVENGQEAIRTIREVKEEKKDPFDLILMDYMMPGLNGYETAGKINEILIESERPRYILVTSYGRDEILDAVDDAGFAGFILKPINQSIMFNTIVEAFGLMSEEDKRKKGEKFPEGFDLVRGASVLLAEDNEINQQVAKEVLEGEGFFVDIANNGREAVDMNSDKDYDIILMDLQMPLLDGYGATEEIRKDESYKDLSIVAMTADAMTGVRDNVIEVGMNDYITKPIDTVQLWKTLVQWIEPGERQLPEGFYPGSVEDVEEAALLPVLGIDVVGGLKRVGGRKKLFADLLERFVSDFNDFESSIVELLSDDNADEAVRLAHTLKGVSANLGVEDLPDKAALLELAIKDDLDVDNRLQAVCSLLQNVVGNIERSGNIDLESTEIKAAKSFSVEDIREKLMTSVASLKKRKPIPAQTILGEFENGTLPEDVGEKLKECSRLLSRYKMKEAIAILENIINGL